MVTRKEFLLFLAGTACGGSSVNCLADGTTVSFNENHGHVLVVSKEDVAAGVAKTYDIRGTADHTHLITITAADMASLTKNQPVSEISTRDGNPLHSHTALVGCA
jgi:hypothetical protein